MTEWASRSVASSQRCIGRVDRGDRTSAARRSRKDSTPSAKSGRLEALPHQLDGVALGRAEAGVQLRVHLPLHDRHRRRRRRCGQVADVVLGGRQHLVGRQRPVDEADAGGLVAVDLAGRVQQVEGVGRARRAG